MARAPGADNGQARLISALLSPAAYLEAPASITRLETHSSHVLLTGQHAYKIKKAVRLPFLDFSTLAKRRVDCETELRLNRRLAPAIYLEVVSITGTVDRPIVGGDGPAVEYAVKMREFPQNALLSRMLIDGTLDVRHIDELAARVAAFHGSIDVAPADGPFGVPGDILHLALDNFSQTSPLLADESDITALESLQGWTQQEFAVRAAALARRRAEGFIRECHGDLHLGNIALVDGAVTVFDCIEFNEPMRWIDVMSEIAFTAMDLQDRRRSDLSFRFLTAYLEHTGDYAGLELLRFYLVYRAMVRGKVAAIRRTQIDPGQEKVLLDEYRGYVKLAANLAGATRSALVIMNGPSGSGKTTCSQQLLEALGAVRVRTDVERKRLHGLAVTDNSRSSLAGGLYSDAATGRTYQAVCAAAARIISAGFPAIVDGSFLKRRQRERLHRLAIALRIPFLIVMCTGSGATLRARVSERLQRGGDASEADLAVLEHQLTTLDPLGPDELSNAVIWDADAPSDQMREAVVHAVVQRLDRGSRTEGRAS